MLKPSFFLHPLTYLPEQYALLSGNIIVNKIVFSHFVMLISKCINVLGDVCYGRGRQK